MAAKNVLAHMNAGQPHSVEVLKTLQSCRLQAGAEMVFVFHGVKQGTRLLELARPGCATARKCILQQGFPWGVHLTPN